jgi:hypothetical protein
MSSDIENAIEKASAEKYDLNKKSAIFVENLPQASVETQKKMGEQVWSIFKTWHKWNFLDSSRYVETLEALLPYVPEQYIPKLWEMACNEFEITGEDHAWMAEKAFVLLAPFLPSKEKISLLSRLDFEKFQDKSKAAELLIMLGNEFSDEKQTELHLKAWEMNSRSGYSSEKNMKALSPSAHLIVWQRLLDEVIAKDNTPNWRGGNIIIDSELNALASYAPSDMVEIFCCTICEIKSFVLYPSRKAILVKTLIETLPYDQQKNVRRNVFAFIESLESVQGLRDTNKILEELKAG